MNNLKKYKEILNELGGTISEEITIDQTTSTKVFEITTKSKKQIHLMISKVSELNSQDTYMFEVREILEDESKRRVFFQQATSHPIEIIDTQIQMRMTQINDILNTIDMLKTAKEKITNIINSSSNTNS